MVHGVLSVMTRGQTKMPLSFVDSWDFLPMVSTLASVSTHSCINSGCLQL